MAIKIKLGHSVICASCKAKYPLIHAGLPVDQEALALYDCEVCEGDTDPAIWGYGTPAQIADAAWFNRDDNY